MANYREEPKTRDKQQANEKLGHHKGEGTGEERATKLLVCDIQGCYVGERYEFQLNDPVIHSQAGESGCGDCCGCCCDSTPSSSPRRASGACLG